MSDDLSTQARDLVERYRRSVHAMSGEHSAEVADALARALRAVERARTRETLSDDETAAHRRARRPPRAGFGRGSLLAPSARRRVRARAVRFTAGRRPRGRPGPRLPARRGFARDRGAPG